MNMNSAKREADTNRTKANKARAAATRERRIQKRRDRLREGLTVTVYNNSLRLITDREYRARKAGY